MLPEQLIEAGQDLRDRQSPQLEHMGAGLWILRTAHDRHPAPTETELLLSGRKVKSYTCTCNAFAKTQQCAHLAAVLALAHLSKRPKPVARATHGPKSLSTKSLLARVPDAELRRFLLSRARRDTDLMLALQTQFAHHTKLRDRFGLVLARALKRRGEAYSAKELRRITETLVHFDTLRERWRAERAWVDLLELAAALVERLVVVIDRLGAQSIGSQRGTVRDYLLGVFGDLRAIAEAPAAPALLESLNDWLDAQLDRGTYYRQELDGQLVQILALLPSDDGAAAAAARSAIDRFGVSDNRLSALRTTLSLDGRESEADSVVDAHVDRIGFVLETLRDYVAERRYRRATEVCFAALKTWEAPTDRQRLIRFYFALSSADTDAKFRPALVAEWLLAGGSLSEIIPEAIGPARREKAIRGALAHVRAHSAVELEAELLTSLAEWPALVDVLVDAADPGLFRRYLPPLAAALPSEALIPAVERVLEGWLARRLGGVASEDTAALLATLSKGGHREAVTELTVRLQHRYSDRPTLLQALTKT